MKMKMKINIKGAKPGQHPICDNLINVHIFF
jgi:hypothetical protein